MILKQNYNYCTMSKLKLSKKHITIFKRIADNGYYRPTYSDMEPATKTLLKNGIIEWRQDFRGLILTEYGKKIVNELEK